MIIRGTITNNYMEFKAGDGILLEVPEIATTATVRGRLLIHAQIWHGLFSDAAQHEFDRKTVITSKVLHVAYCRKDGFLAIQFEGDKDPSILTVRVNKADSKAAGRIGKKLIEKKHRYVPPKALRNSLVPARAHART